MANESKPAATTAKSADKPQPVPGSAPTAPAAPAQAAAKAKAPKKVLTPEQQALKTAMDEARKRFNEAIGKTKSRAASTREGSTGGFDPSAKIEVADPKVFGEKNKKLVDALGTGKTLREALAMEGIDWPTIRRHLVRGHLKMNGFTIWEAFKAVPPKAEPAQAAPATK